MAIIAVAIAVIARILPSGDLTTIIQVAETITSTTPIIIQAIQIVAVIVMAIVITMEIKSLDMLEVATATIMEVVVVVIGQTTTTTVMVVVITVAVVAIIMVEMCLSMLLKEV